MSEISFKSGYVAIVGRPNVGKSTLLNALLKQKVAAVSPRPQTTRRRQLGILTLDNAQIVFVDTPGMHKPVHKLGEFMNQAAIDALLDADLILWMVDSSEGPAPEDREIAERMAGVEKLPPVIMILNKIDLVPPYAMEGRKNSFTELFPARDVLNMSATKLVDCDRILQEILNYLPEGPAFFDAEQVTDLYEREIAADLVRQACLMVLKDEIPHAIAVRIDDYLERENGVAAIIATIFVERESHKGIVIGKGAVTLKTIGILARKEIEEMNDRKVFLELHVKVNKNWRNSPDALRLLGYRPREE